jgi:hypothetical protein
MMERMGDRRRWRRWEIEDEREEGREMRMERGGECDK